MSTFTKPAHGNVGRLASPINRVRNLVRRLNKQARDRKAEAESEAS